MGIASFAAALLLVASAGAQQTGKHPEWDRWCGKAYEPKYPSFEPGGETVEPPKLAHPALDLQFQPRRSIYLDGEDEGEFVVSALASSWRGQAWPGLNRPASAPTLVFTINLVHNDAVLVSNRVNVSSGASPTFGQGHVFKFNFTQLEPSMKPYKVVLFGATEQGMSNVTASSELLYLPEKKSGSVARLDNLNGGFEFRNAATGGKFVPFLPYGYYASCDGFLCATNYTAQIKAYQALGLNSMVSLATVQDASDAYKFMDSIDMRYMYDLRGSYMNLTAVQEQVSVIRDYDSIYSYWGADEPDGHQDPFDLLPKARDLIRQLDPYHPVSVTLNCQNFYFEKYTAGADFIMEDVYPIAINATFSKWGTPCNATYGDCGCDNCHGNVQDVSSRLDDLALYESWLGLWPKTKAHNPQAFNGEDYWFRDPTAAEEVAMNALGFNHGAKAVAGWVWPYSQALGVATGKFANAVANTPSVAGILVSNVATKVKASGVVDAAYWYDVASGKVLLNVVNGGYEPVKGTVTLRLPKELTVSKDTVVWGTGSWDVSNGVVRLAGQDAMGTNTILLSSK